MQDNTAPLDPNRFRGEGDEFNYVVTDELHRPVRGFDDANQAIDFARASEHYLWQYQLLSGTDNRIRYSWRS